MSKTKAFFSSMENAPIDEVVDKIIDEVVPDGIVAKPSEVSAIVPEEEDNKHMVEETIVFSLEDYLINRTTASMETTQQIQEYKKLKEHVIYAIDPKGLAITNITRNDIELLGESANVVFAIDHNKEEGPLNEQEQVIADSVIKFVLDAGYEIFFSVEEAEKWIAENTKE